MAATRGKSLLSMILIGVTTSVGRDHLEVVKSNGDIWRRTEPVPPEPDDDRRGTVLAFIPSVCTRLWRRSALMAVELRKRRDACAPSANGAFGWKPYATKPA